MLTAALVCRVQGIEWQGFAKAAQQTRLFDDDCAELPQYSDHYTLSPVRQLRCSSPAETNTNLFACVCLHRKSQRVCESSALPCTRPVCRGQSKSRPWLLGRQLLLSCSACRCVERLLDCCATLSLFGTHLGLRESSGPGGGGAAGHRRQSALSNLAVAADCLARRAVASSDISPRPEPRQRPASTWWSPQWYYWHSRACALCHIAYHESRSGPPQGAGECG